MNLHAALHVQPIFACIFILYMLAQLSACHSDSNAETPLGTVEFTEIVSGDIASGVLVMTRKAEVFRDQQTFSTELSKYAQFLQPVEVDFSTHKVILLSMQQFSHGGYNIKVDLAEEFIRYVKVSTTLTHPGPGCPTTAALSAPYQFVSINSIKPIVFQERFEETIC